MSQPIPYVESKDTEVNLDNRHIEDVPSDAGLDTKDGSHLPVDHYVDYPARELPTSRWGRFRYVVL